MMEYQDFLDKYDEWLYCAYMESGAYYDTEREDFDDSEYEDYLKHPEQWEGRV